MGKSSYFREAFLNLILQGDPIDGIAENDGSAPLTVFYVALHLADPGVNGTQQSSETSYGGYARQPVDRSTGGFIIVGNQAKLNEQLDFPACNDGSQQNVTHFSIGTGAVGATPILWSGTVQPAIPVRQEFTAPALKADTVIIEL